METVLHLPHVFLAQLLHVWDDDHHKHSAAKPTMGLLQRALPMFGSHTILTLHDDGSLYSHYLRSSSPTQPQLCLPAGLLVPHSNSAALLPNDRDLYLSSTDPCRVSVVDLMLRRVETVIETTLEMVHSLRCARYEMASRPMFAETPAQEDSILMKAVVIGQRNGEVHCCEQTRIGPFGNGARHVTSFRSLPTRVVGCDAPSSPSRSLLRSPLTAYTTHNGQWVLFRLAATQHTAWCLTHVSAPAICTQYIFSAARPIEPCVASSSSAQPYYRPEDTLLPWADAQVYVACCSEDGSMMAICYETIQGCFVDIYAISIPSDAMLATAAWVYTGCIAAHDDETSLRPAQAMFALSGKTVFFLVGNTTSEVVIWDVAQHNIVCRFQSGCNLVTGMHVFSHDQLLLLYGPHRFEVWNVNPHDES